MGSTYLRRPCQPWPRFDRDTWRVNESPREARELFASRLKGWVRFRPRMFCFVLFCTGTGEYYFPCSADHEQDWQPYPVDPYSAICDDHTYIHTINRSSG